LYNAVFVGGIKRLVQLMRALSRLCDNGDVKSSSGEDLTFGEWMQEHLSVSKQTMSKCKDTGVDKQHDFPSLTCYDNPFAYIMVGSLSWMLSCTWNQLANYPAGIVLPYCRGLKMDRLAVGRNGQVIRVTPSIKVLERALLYGVNKLRCGSPVAAINGRKVINGKTYDAVICATEAKAVPKVVENCSDVFSTISYYPSTIYLHKDESFMPPSKKNWKCWNVEMSSGRKEPQLTFWLNAFFPDARFDENVFQTWAPTHAPKAELILRRSDFERVVHTKDAKAYIDEINELQGKDGIYFAGSYTVYGMGLLEQALISGKHASNTVLRDSN
jgi:predicted NAD/FAD-binding protein